MNNHQNAIFHQITNFLKTPLALLGVDLKNFQFNKICHFANHPYLCKGLFWIREVSYVPNPKEYGRWLNAILVFCEYCLSGRLDKCPHCYILPFHRQFDLKIQ